MIIRRRHTANFTTIGNVLFDDERLAADELGILAFLRSKPHDWEVRRPYLMKRFRIGRDATKRIVDNWLRYGWAFAQKVRLPNGTFDIVYEIRDEPGPTLNEDQVRAALSLVSSDGEASEIGQDLSAGAQPGADQPPTGQPPLAEPLAAKAYVVDSNRLNTELPRTDSTQIEREAGGGYDRKAAFIAAFETRWPTSSIDDRARTAKAARAVPDDQEEAALSGIGPFLEKLKREGRKHTPAGWKYLEQRPWTLAPAIAAEKPATHHLPNGSDQAKAVRCAYEIAGLTAAIRGFMRASDGGLWYRLYVTAQLLALAKAPPEAEWVTLEYQQAGAWNSFLEKFIAVDAWHRLRTGSRAPWPWPPRKDGSVSTGPPDTLMTEQDVEDCSLIGKMTG